MQVTTDDGKYTVVIPEGAGQTLYALRWGEPWRDCCGDHLILSLASNLDDARKELDDLNVKGVFGPGASMTDIINYVNANVVRDRGL